MRFTYLWSSCVLGLLVGSGSAAAALPKLSITVLDGRYSNVYGLNPTASWSNSNRGLAGNIDIDYGIEADVRVTKCIEDVASLPRSLWGKVSSSFGQWGVSARVNFQGLDYKNADLKIDAVNAAEELSLCVEGNINDEDGGENIRVDKIQGTKKFESRHGAIITLNPRLDVKTDEASVGITYEKGGASVEVEAYKDAQTVTISRQLDSENRIRPTLCSSGGLSIDWEHKININDSTSTITTTFKPEKSISVALKEDSGWIADIDMDLNSNAITNVNIGVKKDITF